MTQIKINSTTITRSQIFYLDYDNGDDANDGSKQFPLKTFKKALDSTVTDAIIYFKKGIHVLEPITVNSNYGSCGITDFGKNLFICGEGKNTICVYEPAKYETKRDVNLFVLRNTSTTVTNMIFKHYPNKGDPYSNAIFQGGFGNIFNVCIYQNPTHISYPNSVIYDNDNNNFLKIVNCYISMSNTTYANYSGIFTLKNSLVSRDILPRYGSNNIIRTITDLDLEKVQPDLKNKGLSDDGNIIDVGVYGNTFKWNMASFIVLHNGEYKTIKDGLITVIPKSSLDDLICIKENAITDLDAIFNLINRPYKILALRL